MHKISTSKAPLAQGPYSQGIIGGKTIYLSGQLPINPETGEMVKGDIKEATRQVIKNINAVLAGVAGAISIVRTTVYLKNMEDFDAVNEVYAEFFSETKPARVCVGVAQLPKDADIEIEAIAVME